MYNHFLTVQYCIFCFSALAGIVIKKVKINAKQWNVITFYIFILLFYYF
ncbi:hypothetical protein bthur0009_55870 [Bacillus thuringiensis serovar andalousiensis BGSC 4AW1]|nr:hypothetical protein bthur0009_55870 [Bacillus thuringiensis serovar andalousiensis BGSC 4AW1]